MAFQRFYQIGLIIMVASFTGLLTFFTPRASGNDSEFEPIVEAEMPAGFPETTPVQDVRIKNYPAYRKAEADPDSRGAFWKLFVHIKRNRIAMTAPVEMRYAEEERPRETGMAFLYGKPEMGQTGRQGSVAVVDVPPMVVVSTGVRGPRTPESVSAARDRLTAWLEANQGRYAADGPMRVMAYNSPFVPQNRNYFEVEIPVRPVESSGATEASD